MTFTSKIGEEKHDEKSPETCDVTRKIPEKNYQLVPPDGGWGYAVALSLSIFFSVTIAPMATFGIIYGPFLRNIGEETSATAIANSMFNTVLCLTGLIANPLLQKTTCRKVGLLGAAIYCAGSFTCIFVSSVTELVISFSVIQGVGFGLILPSILTSFNHYFDKRKSMAMGISQAVVAIITIAYPGLYRFTMDEYGFRASVAIVAAIGLNCFPAVLTLQPVSWHMKKKPLNTTEEIVVKEETVEKHKIDVEPLMDQHENPHLYRRNHHLLGQALLNQSKRSLVSAGSFAMSVTSINKLGKVEKSDPEIVGLWQTIIKALDLGLFKDPVYVNIVLGLAFGIQSDLIFVAVLPLMLQNFGFVADSLTLIMMIYFISDLVGRVSLAVLTTMVTISSRKLVLVGVLLSALFRIAFVMNDSFWWIVCVTAILGLLRSIIQALLPLVVAEAYPDRFVTAFSLYMVTCAFVALSCGLFASFIKQFTQSDTMVVHFLTFTYLLCGIPWLLELICTRATKAKS